MNVREVEFGVGDLPEQEVRDSLFAAGSDDEVWVGQICGVETTRDGFWVDRVEGKFATRVIDRDVSDCIDYLLSAAVCETDREQEIVVLRRCCFRASDGFANTLGQQVAPADDLDLDTIIVDQWVGADFVKASDIEVVGGGGSEERRVGREGRSRVAPAPPKNNTSARAHSD